jgi:hypothetical protein
MPKAGQRQPWRLTFQYASQDKASRRAFDSREGAEMRADEMLATSVLRGSSVTLEIENRDTGERYAYPRTADQGETVGEATRNDVNTDEGRAVVDQIDANVERARSLRDAEALKNLADETETLISSLSGKGSINAKKLKRDAWNDAASEAADAIAKAVESAQAQPQGGAQSDEIAERDVMAIEGMADLIAAGAERIAEGVRLHIKASHTAMDLARIGLDMWRRIENKDGLPDIVGDSDQAKKASGMLKSAAADALKRAYSQDEGYDVNKGLTAFWRSVQDFRSDVRAEYLRSLDGDSEEAEAERQRFAKVLASRKDDVPVSAWIAKHFGVNVKGRTEIKRERFQAKMAALKAGQKYEEPKDDEPQLPAIERGKTVVKTLKRDLTKFTPEDVKGLSAKEREELKPEIEAMFEAAKKLMMEFI